MPKRRQRWTVKPPNSKERPRQGGSRGQKSSDEDGTVSIGILVNQELETAIAIKIAGQQRSMALDAAQRLGLGLVEMGASAEVDSTFIQLLAKHNNLTADQAAPLMFALRQKRENGILPDILMRVGGESISPSAVRTMAIQMLTASYYCEAEAVLSEYLTETSKCDADMVSGVIQELREASGAVRATEEQSQQMARVVKTAREETPNA